MSVNQFAVTSHNEEIVSLILQKKFTKEEAYNLAAWLCTFLYMEDDKLDRKAFFQKFNQMVEDNLNS